MAQQDNVDTSSPESAIVPGDEGPKEESADEVWARVQKDIEKQEAAPAPITKETVRGNKPKAKEETPAEPEPEVVPDRVLVAPKLKELAQRTKEPEVDPVQKQLEELRALVAPQPEPTKPDVVEEVRALRQMIEEREQAEAQRAAEEEYEAQIAGAREQMIANLRSESEKYPALLAAGYEEYVFNTAWQAAQEGQEVSEDELFEGAESQLWALYDRLHAIKHGDTTSEDPKAKPATKPKTLTKDLTATDVTTQDIDQLVKTHGKDVAAEKLWEQIQQRQR